MAHDFIDLVLGRISRVRLALHDLIAENGCCNIHTASRSRRKDHVRLHRDHRGQNPRREPHRVPKIVMTKGHGSSSSETRDEMVRGHDNRVSSRRGSEQDAVVRLGRARERFVEEREPEAEQEHVGHDVQIASLDVDGVQLGERRVLWLLSEFQLVLRRKRGSPIRDAILKLSSQIHRSAVFKLGIRQGLDDG